VNAADRLWRAITRRDWPAVTAQMHPTARIDWPHTGERLDPQEYAGAYRTLTVTWTFQPGNRVKDGRCVALEVMGHHGDERWRGACFYDLHDGRIAAGTELWLREGGTPVPPERRAPS
jgi:SnoaL-like domain